MPHAMPQTYRCARVRVMVTGAGGPAAVSVMKSLGADPSVAPGRRGHGPVGGRPVPGAAERADAGPGRRRPGVRRRRARPLHRDGRGRAGAHGRRGAAPAGRTPGPSSPGPGIELLLAPDDALDVCLDKLALAERCAGHGAGAQDRAARQGGPGVLDLPGGGQAQDRQRLAGHLGGPRPAEELAAAGPLGRLPGPGVPARRGVLGRRAGRRARPRGRRRAAVPRAGRLRGLGGRPHGARRASWSGSAPRWSRRPGSPTSPTCSSGGTRRAARPARGEPAVPGRAAADHRQRRGHAAAGRWTRCAAGRCRSTPTSSEIGHGPLSSRSGFVELGEVAAGGRVTHPAPRWTQDHHVHSTFSDDAVSTRGRERGGRAASAGCASCCLADHVRARLGVGAGLRGRRGRAAPACRARRAGRRRGQDPGPDRAARPAGRHRRDRCRADRRPPVSRRPRAGASRVRCATRSPAVSSPRRR